MAEQSINVSASLGGVTISGWYKRDAEGQISQFFDLSTADAGTIASVDTTTNSGTISMDSESHSISDGSTVDIFWTDTNGDLKCAYGAVANLSGTTTVQVSNAKGDTLPSENTSVTVFPVVTANVMVSGDLIKMFVLSLSMNGNCVVYSTDGEILSSKLLSYEPFMWVDKTREANPFAGYTINKIAFSNADSANTNSVSLGILYDSVT